VTAEARSRHIVNTDPYPGGHQASRSSSVMRWHDNNGAAAGRVGEQIRERELGVEQETTHIILPCTVCRLKLHNSETHKKRGPTKKKGEERKYVKIWAEKDEDKKLFAEWENCSVN